MSVGKPRRATSLRDLHETVRSGGAVTRHVRPSCRRESRHNSDWPETHGTPMYIRDPSSPSSMAGKRPLQSSLASMSLAFIQFKLLSSYTSPLQQVTTCHCPRNLQAPVDKFNVPVHLLFADTPTINVHQPRSNLKCFTMVRSSRLPSRHQVER